MPRVWLIPCAHVYRGTASGRGCHATRQNQHDLLRRGVSVLQEEQGSLALLPLAPTRSSTSAVGGRKHHCLPRVFLSERVRCPAKGNRSTLEYERARLPVLLRRGQIIHEHVKPFWALCFWPGQQRTLGAEVGTAGDKKVPETGFLRVLREMSFVPAFLGDGTGEPGLYCQCHSAEAAPGREESASQGQRGPQNGVRRGGRRTLSDANGLQNPPLVVVEVA